MIDRKNFFAKWRDRFGPLNQAQVDSLNWMLDEWKKYGDA